MIKTLLRYRLTALLAVVYLLIAILTNSYASPLSAKTLADFGLHFRDLLKTQPLSLLSSVFLTLGGQVFWQSYAMLLLIVGLCEHKSGWRITALVFTFSHLVTLITQAFSIYLLYEFMRHDLSMLWPLPHDVGPTAGYYGCLGFLVSRNKILRLAGVLLMLLLFSLALSDIGADKASALATYAHLIALIFGIIFYQLVKERVSTEPRAAEVN